MDVGGFRLNLTPDPAAIEVARPLEPVLVDPSPVGRGKARSLRPFHTGAAGKGAKLNGDGRTHRCGLRSIKILRMRPADKWMFQYAPRQSREQHYDRQGKQGHRQ